MDESSYLGFAYVLRHGTVFPDAIPATVLLAFPVAGHMVSKYPLGMPFLLGLTSLAGGWTFALGTNLFIHLATFVVTVKILRNRALSPFWALLFLFHPTAVLYSRTVLSDPASGLLLALGLWQMGKNKGTWAGFWAGIALTFRTGNVIALPIFVLAAFEIPGARLKSRLRAALGVAACSTPGVLLAAYYMLVITRNQMGSNTGSFGLSYFPAMFGGYAVMLMVLYPGLLLAPLFFWWKKRDGFSLSVAGLCYGTLGLYSFWFYRDQGGTVLENLVVGQRYFLEILPAFIVAYAGVLQPIFAPSAARLAAAFPAREKPARVACVCGAFLLCGAAGAGINARHNKLLKPMAHVRDAILQKTAPHDVIFCNTQVGKLLPPGWGEREVIVPSSSRQKNLQAVTTQAQRTKQVKDSAQAANRVFIAYWARPGRDDDAEETAHVRELLEALNTRFVLHPVFSLPEGAVLMQVESVKGAAVSKVIR